jgi:hypothetical protein
MLAKVQLEVLEEKVDFGQNITVVWKHSDVRASNKDWIALYREGADVKGCLIAFRCS